MSRQKDFEKAAMDYCEDHSHCIYFEAGAEHGYQYAIEKACAWLKQHSFKKEVERLHDITDAEEYARQLAHLFLGNALSLQTILLMAIDFGQQHPHWIPVEERLPGKQGKYMFYFSNGDMCYETYYPELKLLGNVTHWMEIVPPRKEE